MISVYCSGAMPVNFSVVLLIVILNFHAFRQLYFVISIMNEQFSHPPHESTQRSFVNTRFTLYTKQGENTSRLGCIEKQSKDFASMNISPDSIVFFKTVCLFFKKGLQTRMFLNCIVFKEAKNIYYVCNFFSLSSQVTY